MPRSTVKNTRTGIDISFAGNNGTDWMIDPSFWDSDVESRAVIYLRAATEFTFSHNARNRYFVNRQTPVTIGANGLDGVADSGDEGIIRYRIDGGFSYGSPAPEFSRTYNDTTPVHQAAIGPLSFATLVYTDPLSGGGAVLGRVGDNGGAIATKRGYFHYGMTDPWGNECHVLAVADDSKAVPGVRPEGANWADDGRLFMFVPEPKTPIAQFRSTGGQFYTTPWTTYGVPKIHAQATVFSGAIECELKALSGDNVFYRINGGSWIEHANPILTDADFSSGANTLEYYYAGNNAYTVTRTVTKNPTFPSASETHGFLYCLSEANWATMQARTLDSTYSFAWNSRIKTVDGNRVQWDSVRRQGTRTVTSGALSNAICAKFYGNDFVPTSDGSARTYAAYAKEQLMESIMVLDPITPTGPFTDNIPMPSREIYYRGYWDYAPFAAAIFTYDILIHQYRSDQHANGITPVEDYYIRDLLARGVMEALKSHINMNGNEAPVGVESGNGLWSTPIKIVGLLTALAMPSYSTPYFGTSGVDGNTTVYPYTPFKNHPITWKKAFLDDDATLRGFPDTATRLGIDQSLTYATNRPGQRDSGNWLSDGRFNDKKDYIDHTSTSFIAAMIACKQFYPTKQFPFAELGYKLCAQGQCYGTLAPIGPRRFYHPALVNSMFPEIADIAKPFIEASAPGSGYSLGEITNGRSLAFLAYYDKNYVPGAVPETQAPTFDTQPASATRTAGESVTFTVVVTGTAPITLQWRKNGVNISGATGTSYTIATTVTGDSGLYDCVATNSVGSVTSAAATLVVNAVEPEPDPVTKRTNYKTPAAAGIFGL